MNAPVIDLDELRQATALDGIMIDAPVRRRAEQIRRRADLTNHPANNPVR